MVKRIKTEDLIEKLRDKDYDYAELANEYLSASYYDVNSDNVESMLIEALVLEYKYKLLLPTLNSIVPMYFYMSDIFVGDYRDIARKLFAKEFKHIISSTIACNLNKFSDRISIDIKFPCEFVFNIQKSLLILLNEYDVEKWANYIINWLYYEYADDMSKLKDRFCASDMRVKLVTLSMLDTCVNYYSYIIPSLEDFKKKELNVLIDKTCVFKGLDVSELYMEKLKTIQTLYSKYDTIGIEIFRSLENEFIKCQDLYLEVNNLIKSLDGCIDYDKNYFNYIQEQLRVRGESILKNQISLMERSNYLKDLYNL